MTTQYSDAFNLVSMYFDPFLYIFSMARKLKTTPMKIPNKINAQGYLCKAVFFYISELYYWINLNFGDYIL